MPIELVQYRAGVQTLKKDLATVRMFLGANTPHHKIAGFFDQYILGNVIYRVEPQNQPTLTKPPKIEG